MEINMMRLIILMMSMTTPTTLKKIDYPPITERAADVMLGSCNGVVCFFVHHHGIDDPVYICNPVTSEYVYFPRLTTCETHDSLRNNMVTGFGYHHSTNEYKDVRIYYDYNQPSLVGQVQVYTLGGGDGWRNKGEITHSLYPISSKGVFANGAIHWMDAVQGIILAFDLADEEFRLLPSPPPLEIHKSSHVGIRLWGGYLCVFYVYQGKCVDIWTLKKKKKTSSCDEVKEQAEYNSSWSWSRELSIAWEGPVKGTYYWPFALAKSNEVLLFYNRILSCYDPKTATLKKLWDDDMGSSYIEAIPHMNSLVSLKALGEKSVMRRR
ncbi:hypothetical protein BVC80_879g13 [Macleaya cordata]|uniref:F-box associated beta-propeller type 3 domain-containing protein n=1 Tax=Macleaya cordata TaxID=56857 RepID=A0A200PYS4_MACCD|nr:hypothetical protein BVC80_879g13 [Macleaya cordata]